MKKTNLKIKILYIFLILQVIAFTSLAQVKYPFKDNVSIVINGTSTLHDWDMKSTKCSGDVRLIINASGRITELTSLYFSTPVVELKSDHSGLDKNAYKALKKDKYSSITFAAIKGTVNTTDGINYTVKSTGKLTIAGTAKDIELISSLKLNADKSITVSGTQKINMVDWGVEPPSFMFGAMKTGKDIVLHFSATIKIQQ